MDKRFRVALSFTGEKREFVEAVAELLAKQFGREHVLYDRYHKAEFARPNLAMHLPKLYKDEAELVVVVLCDGYAIKPWPGLEWRATLGLIKQRKDAEVMLCRFDGCEPDELMGLAGFVELENLTPAALAELIQERIVRNAGDYSRGRRGFDESSDQPELAPALSAPVAGHREKQQAISRLVNEEGAPRPLGLTSPADVAACSRFFELFCKVEDQPTDPSRLAERLLLANATEQLDVRLVGSQGSGKSTFLAVLHQMLSSASPDFYVIYVDANQFIASDLAELTRRFAAIESCLLDSEAAKVVFLMDHLSARAPKESEELCHQLVDRIPARSIRAVFWSLGDGFEHTLDSVAGNNLESFKRIVVDISPPSPDSPDLGEFLKRYTWLHGRLHGHTNAIESVRSEVLEERVPQLMTGSTIDLYLLSLLCDKLEAPSYRNVTRLTDFLQIYCTERTDPSETYDRALVAAGQLAHRLVAQSFYCNPPPALRVVENQRRGKAWEIATAHGTMRDFLCAWYVCLQLRSCSKSEQVPRIVRSNVLNFDYPKVVCGFLIQIINALTDRERGRFGSGCRGVLSHLKKPRDAEGEEFFQSRNLIYYLLGRTDKTASNLLSNALDETNALLNELPAGESTSRRIALKATKRTLSVSLIMYQQAGPGSAYLRSLLTTPEDAAIDRGYHQLYYGDRRMSKELSAEQYLDVTSAGWLRSYRALQNKLERLFSDEETVEEIASQFEIQHCLLTMVSFAQSRMEKLHCGQIEYITRLLDRVLSCERALLPDLVDYLRMIHSDLKRGDTSPWRFVFDLYRMKWEPRRGWLKRGVNHEFEIGRIESVADHSYFAIVLATLLLPETIAEYPKYSKDRVIELVTFHDCGEAFTGDFLPSDEANVQQTKQKLEESSMRHVRFKESYPQIFRTQRIYAGWRAFSIRQRVVTNDGSDIDVFHASLARDIDKLENILQLVLYRRLHPEAITEAEYHRFSETLSPASTQIGRELMGSALEWAKLRGDAADAWPTDFRTSDLLSNEESVRWPSRNGS